MGNCFGIPDANDLVLQIQLSEKEKEIQRMKDAHMAQDKRMLQDAQEMQEVSKLRELLLVSPMHVLCGRLETNVCACQIVNILLSQTGF